MIKRFILSFLFKAWLVYSAAIYVRHEEESGLLRLLPIAAALITMGPLLGAIHWAVTIDPVYDSSARRLSIVERDDSDFCRDDCDDDDDDSDSDGNKSKKSKNKKKKCIFHFWQIFTVVSRIISLALLCYVYHEHWLEVGGDSVRLAVLETVPYALLVVLGNVGLQYAAFGGTLFSGLLAVFLPNQIPLKKQQEITLFEGNNQVQNLFSFFD